ncbi:DUF2478 domain-containing protein [Alsobacter sp. R-9]
MSNTSQRVPITAIVYGEGQSPGPLLASVATRLKSLGKSVAGFVEREAVRAGRSRCDMILADLFSGESIQISEDRGEAARGCRLNVGELLRAMNSAMEGLNARPDLLVINKFGKEENDGGGVRPLIAEALQREISILIGVPRRNLDGWRQFCGPYCREIDISTADTEGLIGHICESKMIV